MTYLAFWQKYFKVGKNFEVPSLYCKQSACVTEEHIRQSPRLSKMDLYE